MVISNRLLFWIVIFSIILTGCSVFHTKTALDDTCEAFDIPGKFDIVEIDRLNFIYTQSENNILRRHTINSKVKVDYVDNRLGKIDDLDPFDPLNILTFYRSYGIAKILDNTLNVIKIINFRESSPYQNVSQICSSNDGKFWIFDESIQKIVKIDGDFKRLVETNRLSDLNINRPQIVKMRESNNQLFVLISGVGILVFDNFGQFVRKVVVPEIKDFSAIDGKVFYKYTDAFYKIDGIDTRKMDDRSTLKDIDRVTGIKLNRLYALMWHKNGININKLSAE